jgi:hypothetical protein
MIIHNTGWNKKLIRQQNLVVKYKNIELIATATEKKENTRSTSDNNTGWVVDTTETKQPCHPILVQTPAIAAMNMEGKGYFFAIRKRIYV